MKLSDIFLASLCFLFIPACAQEGNKPVPKSNFIPGKTIIFSDNFSTGKIGDLPVNWATNGSGKIVTDVQFPGRWFQMISSGYYIPQVKEKFTNNFTIEFDLVLPTSSNTISFSGIDFLLVSGSLNNPNEGSALPGNAGIKFSPNIDKINWFNWSDVDEGHKDDGSIPQLFKPGEIYHVAFWIQNQHVRLYLNEKEMLDLPNGLIEAYTYNIFRIQTTGEIKPMIANFQIAANLPDKKTN